MILTPALEIEASTRGAGAPSAGEMILLRATRAWTEARAAGLRPKAHLCRNLLGLTSSRVSGLFAAWMDAVERAGRRPLQPGCRHCGGWSADEQRLVVACGLAPVSLDLGGQVLEPLVRDARSAMLLARSLNAALASEGWELPVRLGDRGDAPAGPRTLH